MKVLIADDHAILRRGLREFLQRELAGVECGEAANAGEVLAELQRQHWDLLILDVTMPGRSGLDLLKDLRRLRPRLPVLVLSMHPEDQYARRVLKAGAAGYMNKETAPEELISAIRRVLRGGRYVSATLAETLARDLGRDGEQSPHELLSNRELEVLRKIGAGKTVSEIAEELHVSVPTVSTHRGRLMQKMGMSTTAELMRYALQNDLAES